MEKKKGGRGGDGGGWGVITLCPVQEDQEGSIKSTSGSDRSLKALLQVIKNNIFQFSILVHSPRPTNNLKISQDILNQNCSKI